MNWVNEFATTIDYFKDVGVTKKWIQTKLKKIDEKIRLSQNNFVSLNNSNDIESLEELYFQKAVLETLFNNNFKNRSCV